jgi:hypothetical protein
VLTGAAGALALVAALNPRAPQPVATAGGTRGGTTASRGTAGAPTTPATSSKTTSAAGTTGATRTSRPTSAPGTTPERPAGGGVLVAAALAPVRDAGTLFRIRDLRCGLTTVGSGPSAFDLDPGQEACTALVTVRNVSRNPHGAGVQFLRDRTGRTYGSNGFLTPAMDREALELHVLQPGEGLESALVWQVPPGFRPVEVVVHGDLITLGAHRRVG